MENPQLNFPDANWLASLESLGTPEFYERFLNWLHLQLNTDQCMVFFCPDGDRLTTLISKDFGRDQHARQLALSYIADEHYRNDPNFNTVQRCKPGELITLPLTDISSKMTRQYRERYITGPGFVDKWSVVCSSSDGNFYINLYSRRGNFDSLFQRPDSGGEQHIARLIAMLITKHYLLNHQLLNQGPLAPLSERERQVCEAMLAGKKAEAIAHELGVAASSIVTYRKRAYEKLDICSKAQLFALCR